MAKAAIVSANATGEVALLYNPYQQAFLAAKRARLPDGRRAYNRLGVFSGRRGGKTRIGGVGVAEELTIAGSMGWACAPTYPELQDYVIPAVFSVVPNAWIKDWSASKLEMLCHNGARVQFRSLDDPDRARGPGLDWAWIDEARKVQEKAWDTLLPALVDKRGTCWVTTSPNGCIASGSLVATSDGNIPIEQVRVGQFAWTRRGWKRITHVTYMGDKPTVVVWMRNRRLVCTPDHRLATSHGWCEAGSITTRLVCGVPTDPTPSFPLGAPEIRPRVGMPLRTMGDSQLTLHPGGTSDVLAVADSLQMIGVDAPAIPADVVEFHPIRNHTLRQEIGELEGACGVIDPSDPTNANQRIPDVSPSLIPWSIPHPTAVFVQRSVFAQPDEIQVEPCEVSRVSHGYIIPVWDIGVEDEHEFLADGFLVHNCDWVHRRFYQPAYNLDPGFWACKYKTLDNPSIDPDEVAAAQKQLDPLFFQQEFGGDFVSFAGAVFGALIDDSVLPKGDMNKLIPEWPNIHPWRPCIVGLDPGADHPFAGVLIVETEAGMVVAAEYVARHLPIGDHAVALHKMVGKLRPEQWACDKSQRQTIIELHQHGIMAAPAPNDVVAGIQRVSSWLRARRLWLPEDTCPTLIEQMRSYRWDENIGRDGQSLREQVIKIQDDLIDATRYALCTWAFSPNPADSSAPEQNGLRDLSTLPDETRWSLERLRACDNPVDNDDETLEYLSEPDPTSSPLGDFWR